MKVINECPLCGKENNCKGDDDRCWCFEEKVPKKLLEKISEEKRGKACVCQSCINEYDG